MTLEIGGNTLHMEKVQVHPTGLVVLKEPNAKVKVKFAKTITAINIFLSIYSIRTISVFIL